MSTVSNRFALFLLVTVLGVPGIASAQVTPLVMQGQNELLGLVGIVTDGGGATIGGGVQHAIRDRILLAVEASYLTGGDDFDSPGFDVDSSGFAVDVNVQYLFPLEETERFTPYALGGIGYLRSSVSVAINGFDESASDNTVGLNLGGGARVTLSPRWTLRPELRILIASGSHVRLTVGLLYLLGQ